jgi:hypothetical protein
VWLHASCLAQDVVQRKSQQDVITVGSTGKKRGRKSLNKESNITSTEDAAAEDDNMRVKVVASDSEAPKVEIIDKETEDETEEPVHCLVCKELIE